MEFECIVAAPVILSGFYVQYFFDKTRLLGLIFVLL
jgi:hypothetical protein